MVTRTVLGCMSIAVATSAGCALVFDPDEYQDPNASASSSSSSSSSGSAGAGASGGDGGGSGGELDPACPSDPDPESVVTAWSRQGNAEPSSVRAIDVAADSAGNAYLLGGCAGPVDLAGDMFDCTGIDAETYFVAKIDATGTVVWHQLVDAADLDPDPQQPGTRAAITVSETGDDIWIGGGYAGGTTSISMVGCSVNSVPGGGGGDAFLAHLDNQGVCTWLKVYGGDVGDDYITDVVAMDGSRVAVVGQYRSSIQIGSEMLLTGLPNGGTFAALFEANGAPSWAQDLEGGNLVDADARVAYHDGVLLAAGTFGGSFQNVAVEGGGSRDVFIVRLDTSGGTPGPATLFGGSQQDRLLDLAFGEDGVAALISFEQTVDIPGSGSTLEAAGVTEGAVIGLDAALVPRFATDLDGFVGEGSIVFDPINRDLVWSVTSSKPIGGLSDLGSGNDVYMGRVGCGGEPRWLARFGDGDAQRSLGLATTPSGAVYSAGTFAGGIDFGDNMIAGDHGDAFIVRFHPAVPR